MNPVKPNPIVTIQCPKCKAVFLGCVERYMTDEDKAETLNYHLGGYVVQRTDGPIKLSECTCEGEA